jgi:alpha-glucosidase
MSNANEPAWWQGATIYQVYLRSFLDTNGDGVGDLPGVIERLDYIASLGVEAVWISPFFKSPMADFGYDISDYRAVDPLFGNLQDFDRLLHRAHDLGLKVMIDQVLSHTSSQHSWFDASRQDRTNVQADWYVWADARPDGGPPNNWLSIFGGSAWKWEPRRAQCYLHNFLAEQPDLNFHHPEVRRSVLDNVRFWLDRGVDGLRLDAINFCFHDSLLRDNPPKPLDRRSGRGFRADNPYAYQYHLYDNTRPEALAFVEELRALIDQYPGVVTLGEISAEDSNATMAEYTRPGRLHMAYSFELLGNERTPAHIRTTVEAALAGSADAWPCWSISNHDVERVISRWGGSESPAHFATQLTALVCSLRGGVCIFQGEELGLKEAEVPFESLRDPYGIAFWPAFKGRDGCRTPMPWTRAEHGGFSTGTPWLPVAEQHLNLAVDVQERDPGSALHAFRHFMRWRKRQPALLWGSIEFLEATDNILAFIRRLDDEILLAGFNLSSRPAVTELPKAFSGQTVRGHGLPEGQLNGRHLELPPHGVVYCKLQSTAREARMDPKPFDRGHHARKADVV